MNPGGIRLGTPALTTRGFKEAEMAKIAEWCKKAVEISLRLQSKVGKKLTDFIDAIHTDEEIAAIRLDVIAFAKQYSMPGL